MKYKNLFPSLKSGIRQSSIPEKVRDMAYELMNEHVTYYLLGVPTHAIFTTVEPIKVIIRKIT